LSGQARAPADRYPDATMEVIPVDPFGLFGGMMVAILLVPLLTTILIIGVIVWAIRRVAPQRDDPAVAELKTRLARGEIDMAEYLVRMRALRDGED
jgi:uncharacterized membrane protein